MDNTTIIFYSKSGQKIDAKLKAFISAEMLVEITKILRKYTKKFDDFIKIVLDKNFELESLTDVDFLRAKKYMELSLTKIEEKNTISNIFNEVYNLYEDEMNREVIPLITDIKTISNKEIVEMLKDSESLLWGQQDIYSFREICKKVCP